MSNQPIEPTTYEQNVAILLHDIHCRDNHTDGCSWYYEKAWEGVWAHERYLKMAQYVIQNVDNPESTLIMVMRIILGASREIQRL